MERTVAPKDLYTMQLYEWLEPGMKVRPDFCFCRTCLSGRYLFLVMPSRRLPKVEEDSPSSPEMRQKAKPYAFESVTSWGYEVKPRKAQREVCSPLNDRASLKRNRRSILLCSEWGWGGLNGCPEPRATLQPPEGQTTPWTALRAMSFANKRPNCVVCSKHVIDPKAPIDFNSGTGVGELKGSRKSRSETSAGPKYVRHFARTAAS